MDLVIKVIAYLLWVWNPPKAVKYERSFLVLWNPPKAVKYERSILVLWNPPKAVKYERSFLVLLFVNYNQFDRPALVQGFKSDIKYCPKNERSILFQSVSLFKSDYFTKSNLNSLKLIFWALNITSFVAMLRSFKN